MSARSRRTAAAFTIPATPRPSRAASSAATAPTSTRISTVGTSTDLPPWTPLERAHLQRRSILEDLEHLEALARDYDASVETARQVLDDIERHEAVWVNSRYQVNVRHLEARADGWPALVHLSIKRRDRAPLGPERYRDFMRIKDELLGPEHEAVELYPARSRETDAANQYHLFCLASDGIRFPFGFDDARHVTDLPNGGRGASGARQAPFEAHHR